MNRLSQSSSLLLHSSNSYWSLLFATTPLPAVNAEFAITADKGTNYNSLIQIAVQSYESDTSTISATIVRLQFRDNLHRSHLRRTTQGTSRESIDEFLNMVSILSNVPLTRLTR